MNREAKVTVIPDTARTYHLIERVAALEAERDALAAHVELLTEECEKNDQYPSLWRVVKQSPDTSLAQLKARVAAEAIRTIADSLNLSIHANMINKFELRKRADEIEAGGNHES